MAIHKLTVFFNDDGEDWGVDYLEEAIEQAGGLIETSEVIDS